MTEHLFCCLQAKQFERFSACSICGSTSRLKDDVLQVLHLQFALNICNSIWSLNVYGLFSLGKLSKSILGMNKYILCNLVSTK